MISKARRALGWALILMAIGFSGCPDRSYQAPALDYSDMKDGGGESSSELPVESR